MRVRRVFVADPLVSGERVWVEDAAANHIVRVLRLSRGDTLAAFDGLGGEYDAIIEDIRKDRVLLGLGEHHPLDRESPRAVTLAQGISRGERMDFVVQKATELGVRRIVPIIAERSVVRLAQDQKQSRLRHWRGVAIAACEQCGRNTLPQIDDPVPLDEYIAAMPDAQPPSTVEAPRWVLSPLGTTRIRDLKPPSEGLTLLIGPEGGLSESEHDLALTRGWQALQLGPRILRTETAAIAAIAAIQQQHGDL
jgi:16S rRNA (uracil1498-N3)-methyltransferase